MSRTAYLRGNGIEVVVEEDQLPSMEAVAKVLGLRRLKQVSVGEGSAASVILRCTRCGERGTPRDMLANLDGKPYYDYEHITCPQKKEVCL